MNWITSSRLCCIYLKINVGQTVKQAAIALALVESDKNNLKPSQGNAESRRLIIC